MSPKLVGLCKAFEVSIDGTLLSFKILQMLELDGESRLEWSIEVLAKPSKPLAMSFGPRGLAFFEDVAVVTEDARDAMHGSRTVGVVSGAQSEEASECLVILGGDVDRGEMSATIQAGEHDGIEAVGLTVVARSSWDQGWSDDLAVKAVTSKDSLEHKAGTGSFIAGSDWTFV